MFEDVYEKLNYLTKLLIENELTISIAESITAGRFAALLTSIPGASKYFDSSIVAYSNESKINILGVDEKIILEFGAVSKETAGSMVDELAKKSQANVLVSFTGNSGPETMEEKKIGLSYIGISLKNKKMKEIFEFNSTKTHREEIIWETMEFAINQLLLILRKNY